MLYPRAFSRALRTIRSQLGRPILHLLGWIFRKLTLLYEICWAYSAKIPPTITIGRQTYGHNDRTFCLATGKEEVEIGEYCSIAAGVKFILGDHELNRVSTFPFRFVLLHSPSNTDAIYRGRIIVGNDVWIGQNSLILANVRIGDGAVIAAGSVVSKDVAPYAVVGGVPAREIKKRFTAAQIGALLEIRWWDWPEEKIIRNMDLFYEDIDTFIAVARNGLDSAL